MSTLPPLPRWEAEGFARKPQTYVSVGTEIIFRCYSTNPGREVMSHDAAAKWNEGSQLWGNCFFVPLICPEGKIYNDATYTKYKKKWTWEYLESQLNAWFWGNDYERVSAWKINSGVKYRIGLVGQSTMANSTAKIANKDGSFSATSIQQRHLPWPNLVPELKQVVLDVNGTPTAKEITKIDSMDWKVVKLTYASGNS
ncbi:hypothetical protein [Ketobacter sp.]|uniref:hypothetical protein n=1 Tax=Ketobacter sp. TaxID=2083498 RepID=UPI0025BFC5A8|nr:hypothetical protein [Ketobacter sp.]